MPSGRVTRVRSVRGVTVVPQGVGAPSASRSQRLTLLRSLLSCVTSARHESVCHTIIFAKFVLTERTLRYLEGADSFAEARAINGESVEQPGIGLSPAALLGRIGHGHRGDEPLGVLGLRVTQDLIPRTHLL